MAIRRTTIVVTVIVVVAATIALLLSVRANPDRYRPEVISFLEARTGKQIEVGHISMTWIPPAIHLDGFGSRNPEPFPTGYFLKAASIDAAIDVVALLHRRIVIKSMVLHDPIINVISDPDGQWNFENLPSKTSEQRPPIFAFGVISRVEITGGHLFASSLIDPSDRPGPVVFEAHNFAATLEQVDFNAFTGPASSLVATGALKADSLRLGRIEVTKVSSKLRLLTKQVFFEALSVEADRGRVTGELSFNLAGAKAHFDADARLSDLDVAQFLARFPEGRGKMTGTMDGQLKLTGEIEHSLEPLAKARGTGHLRVRDGELPTLSASDDLRKMARFRDPQDAARGASSFSSFSTDLDMARERISSRDVSIAFYGVDIQCAGSLGFGGDGILDYQGVARILKKQGFFTNIFGKVWYGAKEENGKLVFPIRIRGTLIRPKFSGVD
jgi:hypothetical protein